MHNTSSFSLHRSLGRHVGQAAIAEPTLAMDGINTPDKIVANSTSGDGFMMRVD